jgi:hypothetical protein
MSERRLTVIGHVDVVASPPWCHKHPQLAGQRNLHIVIVQVARGQNEEKGDLLGQRLTKP